MVFVTHTTFPKTCLLASKSYFKTIQFVLQNSFKIHPKFISNANEFVDSSFHRCLIDLYDFLSELALISAIKIIPKSFKNHFGRPRSIQEAPRGLHEALERPQKCLGDACKRSLGRPTTATERASRLTTVHRLIKLRNNIKFGSKTALLICISCMI